jgi:hypothetical protein
MKFSEYLRKLDEGNLGQELEKRGETGSGVPEEDGSDFVKDVDGDVMRDPVTSKPVLKKVKKKKINDSIERDALGRISIKSIQEGEAHMKRQLGSGNIPYAQKREIQKKLRAKQLKDRERQMKRASDPDTSLDIAVRAGDAASEPVTPAPKKQLKLTPAQKARAEKNAPTWVKKRTEEVKNLEQQASDRENAAGMNRQSHLDKPK